MTAADLTATKLVQAGIADHEWDTPVIVRRGHVPMYRTLPETPLILVGPVGRSRSRVGRKMLRTANVVVAILARLQSGQGVRDNVVDDLSQLEGLIGLTDQVERFLMDDTGEGRNFADETGNFTVVEPVTVDPTYSVEELSKGRYIAEIDVTLEELLL